MHVHGNDGCLGCIAFMVALVLPFVLLGYSFVWACILFVLWIAVWFVAKGLGAFAEEDDEEEDEDEAGN